MIAAQQTRQNRRFVLVRVGECLYRSDCGSYFAVVKHLGRQHRQCLRTKDRNIAKKRLAEYRQRVGSAPAAKTTAAGLTFSQVAARWLDSMTVHIKQSTHERRVTCVNNLLRLLKDKSIGKISLFDCERWATTRSKQVKGRTFNADLETLVLIFKYAISHGFLTENPAAGLRRRPLDYAAVIVPSKMQFRMIVADMRLRAVESANWIEFLGYSGCRTGEAGAVCWKDVDWERKSISITGGETGTKNHECRVIPLFLPLERLLVSIRSSLRRPPGQEAKILKDVNAMWALRTACKRLGFPRFHRHSLRHFFASNCVEAGVDFRTVAGWLGHRDGGSLLAKTYSHLRAEHSVEMAKRVVFDAGQGEAI